MIKKIKWDYGDLRYIREYLGVENFKLHYTNNEKLYFVYGPISKSMKLRTSDFRRSRKYAPVRNYEFPYSFYHILLKFLTDKRIKLCKKGSKKT